jgi:septal ring factor EnvC (AmiA/AmiB activator)
LISAKEGTDIRAVSGGQVVFADWLKGYGWLIIINHGGGYMSLYAFNQTVYKKVGEHVKAGMIIAAVGSSGGREESGLYFGIRNNGKPVNPAIWCKK